MNWIGLTCYCSMYLKGTFNKNCTHSKKPVVYMYIFGLRTCLWIWQYCYCYEYSRKILTRVGNRNKLYFSLFLLWGCYNETVARAICPPQSHIHITFGYLAISVSSSNPTLDSSYHLFSNKVRVGQRCLTENFQAVSYLCSSLFTSQLIARA